jgi:alkylation response protein AidB-like acyl-CoA dehydrogenase
MDFLFTDEQLELRAAVRGFLGRKSAEESVRRLMATDAGYDPAVWQQMSDQLGLQGMAVPEEYEGAGFGYLELGIVFEEMGRALLCAPYLSSVALAAEALLRCADESARKDLLPGLATGQRIGTLALLEQPGRWDEASVQTRAHRSGAGWWVLDGGKRHVPDGHIADLILVGARTPAGIGLFAVDGAAPGVTRVPVPTLDQTRKQAHLDFAGTPARLIGDEGDGGRVIRRVLDTAAILLAAEQAGGALRVVEMAAGYAGMRVQFGRPIGSFQAVKHLCADMLTEAEAARSAAYYGLWALAADSEDVPLAASLAKVYCSAAYSKIAGDAIQVHGGIGFTWEHPAHLYFKRAKSSEVMFGTPARHRDVLAARLDLEPKGRSEGGMGRRAGPRRRTENTDIEILPEDLAFADEVQRWLDSHLVGEFAEHRGVGGPDDSTAWDVRLRWEKELSAGGWLGLTWPPEYGGRGATLAQAIIFEYLYARAEAPYRVGVQGQDLFGPTLLMFGTAEQKARFLPKILAAEEFWGQGFSEPDAGSDLASVRTQARLVKGDGEVGGDEWVIDGQKIWMTFGASADWLYVLCRTDTSSSRHRGLSLLLVPARQPGVQIRPITNMLGAGEFCEVFFTGARTRADLVVGAPGDGWKVAMAALGVERGTLLMPQQLGFEREAEEVLRLARSAGGLGAAAAAGLDAAAAAGLDAAAAAGLSHRLVDAWIAVRLMRVTALRTIGELVAGRTPGAQAATSKLYASVQHQRLLELATELLAEEATVTGEGYALEPLQRAFLLSRAETIYGGSSQIQRNIIGERVLGLPKEPRPG